MVGPVLSFEVSAPASMPTASTFAESWPDLRPEQQTLLQPEQLKAFVKLRSLFLKQATALETACEVVTSTSCMQHLQPDVSRVLTPTSPPLYCLLEFLRYSKQSAP